MLIIRFEFLRSEEKKTFSKFELGNITIIGKYGYLTSASKVPNQSMMIIISVVDLLDLIINFFPRIEMDKCTFIGADSSFQFELIKEKNERIILIGNKKLIDDVTFSEFISAIWNGVYYFYSNTLKHRNLDETEFQDLRNAIIDFRNFFSHYLKDNPCYNFI